MTPIPSPPNSRHESTTDTGPAAQLTSNNNAATSRSVSDGVAQMSLRQNPDRKMMFTNRTKAIVWGMQQRAVQGMLDFDYVCSRKEPSVVAITYPFVYVRCARTRHFSLLLQCARTCTHM